MSRRLQVGGVLIFLAAWLPYLIIGVYLATEVQWFFGDACRGCSRRRVCCSVGAASVGHRLRLHPAHRDRPTAPSSRCRRGGRR